MAGDWMKVEMETPDKPEVHYMASVLGMDPDAVFGKLFRVWAWFDKQSRNGHAAGVTYSLIDRVTAHNGFGEVMALAGWLKQDGHALVLPNFERHNGKTAKSRALAGTRKKNQRAKDVTDESRSERDTRVTREEKRRKKPHTPSGPVSDNAFDAFWSAYPNKVAKPEALKAWKKIGPDENLVAAIMAGLARAKASPKWRKNDGEFIANPSTWLNQQRWNDQGVAADLLDDVPRINGSNPYGH